MIFLRYTQVNKYTYTYFANEIERKFKDETSQSQTNPISFTKFPEELTVLNLSCQSPAWEVEVGMLESLWTQRILLVPNVRCEFEEEKGKKT